MENFNMKKFRAIRQLISSIVCIILAVSSVMITYPDDNILLKLLLMVLGTGMFYCMFSLAGIFTSFMRNGFIKRNNVLNCIVDTIIYLTLCVGAIFLVAFVFNKIIWLGLLFTLGGVFEVYRDIHYLIELDAARNQDTDNNYTLEPTKQ